MAGAGYERFSQRQKKLTRAGQPTLYRYDVLSDRLRGQVMHILQDVTPEGYGYWQLVYAEVAREFGIFRSELDDISSMTRTDRDRFRETFFKAKKAEDALDMIEIAFRQLERSVPPITGKRKVGAQPSVADQAIADLNRRFAEHDLGYWYSDGYLLTKSSEYMYNEVVEPAVALLHVGGFRGPLDEFLRAHEHYRHGRYKEATADALKAFESTMKTICDLRGWPYDAATATAKTLVGVVLDQGLVPPYMQEYFNGGLRKVLEAGVPTVRNKTSGHGQGRVPVTLPEHVAAYALHMTAANIVFLIQAHETAQQQATT